MRDSEQNEPQALLAWLSDRTAALHGGESMADLSQRVGACLAACPAGMRCVAISHPMVLRAAADYVLGIPLQHLSQLDIAPVARLALSEHGRWNLHLG